MGFSGGSGSSGSIGGASDSALNNPTDGQVLTYSSSLGKWQNQVPVSGGAQALTATSVKTSAYTAAAGDLIPADATAAAFIVTLPTTPADRSRLAVKKLTAR